MTQKTMPAVELDGQRLAGPLPEPGHAAVVVAPARLPRFRPPRRCQVPVLRHRLPPGARHGAQEPLILRGVRVCRRPYPPFFMSYRAPRWLPGGHLQTIYPATCIAKPPVAFRRERWTSADGDFVDVDFVDGQPGQPLVVLFHGLEGSSDSHYARALMASAGRARLVGRGAAFSRLLGRSRTWRRASTIRATPQEVDWIVRRLRPRATAASSTRPASRWAATPCCAGWANRSTRPTSSMPPARCRPRSTWRSGGAALSSGFNMIYTRMFLQTLKPKCLAKLDQFPGLFDRDALLAARDLYAFDNVVTAPLHGYRDTDDYWHRASATPRAGRHHRADPGAQCAQRSLPAGRATCRAAPRRT